MEQIYPLPSVTDETRELLNNGLPKELKEKIEEDCSECNQEKENNGQ